jgi:hypothetical protein
MLGFEGEGISDSPLPRRLNFILGWMGRWRKSHGWVEINYNLDPSIRTLPSPAWRLLSALEEMHLASHIARRDWWLIYTLRLRKVAFIATAGLLASIFIGFYTQFWFFSYFIAVVFIINAALLFILSIISEIDSLVIHRMDRARDPAKQVCCIGGAGKLPGWIGQILLIPTTTMINSSPQTLGEILGVDAWVRELGLNFEEVETLQVLLADWDGATLDEAVSVARALTRF